MLPYASCYATAKFPCKLDYDWCLSLKEHRDVTCFTFCWLFEASGREDQRSRMELRRLLSQLSHHRLIILKHVWHYYLFQDIAATELFVDKDLGLDMWKIHCSLNLHNHCSSKCVCVFSSRTDGLIWSRPFVRRAVLSLEFQYRWQEGFPRVVHVNGHSLFSSQVQM